MALRETQKHFYALDISNNEFVPETDDSCNLVKLRIKVAEEHGSLQQISSTYDFQNNIITEGSHVEGKKIISFSNILKYDTFPLADIINDVMSIGEREMSKGVEIEFAVELDHQNGKPGIFYILQIRPIVENQELLTEDISKIKDEETIISCKSSLGNGQIKGIQHLIYVKPENFDASNSKVIAEQVGQLNEKMIAENKNYILIGPGRWGSSDPWLGIPVKWPQISMARLIVESGLENYRIDPSQGTHFFQNLTSFRVGYFTINPFIGDGHFDLEYLNKLPASYENEYIRMVTFEKKLKIKLDGKNKLGVVLKPL